MEQRSINYDRNDTIDKELDRFISTAEGTEVTTDAKQWEESKRRLREVCKSMKKE